MEDSWDYLVSHREEMVDGENDDDYFNQSHMSSFNEEEFLRDIIIEKPVFSPENDNKLSPNNPSSYSPIQNKFGFAIADPCGVATATSTTNSGLSFDETNLDGHGTLLNSSIYSNNLEKPSPLYPTCYILSFDNSGVEPGYPPQHDPAFVSHENRAQDHCIEQKAQQLTKRARNSSESEVHIIAERKRRHELTQSIVALSSTIPGLKKKDKTHVLREAVNYVKQLEGRVRVLENQNRKKYADSVILMKKTELCINEASFSCETHSDGCSGRIEELPEVEATVLQKEVLIGIHCKKQSQSFLKILTLLNNIHLSVTSTSVLPFGTSTVKITIIAQMGEEYNMTNDDLVKTLRQHLLNLKSEDMQK